MDRASDLTFTVVLAATQSGGIGLRKDLPWPRLKEDVAFFRSLTTTHAEGRWNAVVMGRVTWDSLPPAQKPLPGRINVVVSRTLAGAPVQPQQPQQHPATLGQSTVRFVGSFEQALRDLASVEMHECVGEVFVIGGAQIYKQALAHPSCRRVVLTRVLREFQADRFVELDTLSRDFVLEKADEIVLARTSQRVAVDARRGLDLRSVLERLPAEEQQRLYQQRIAVRAILSNGSSAAVRLEEGETPSFEVDTTVPIQFQLWARKPASPNPEEQQYLDLIRRIIETGTLKGDRTGTGTLSVFASSLRFSLREGRFPLMTSRKSSFQIIVRETLWMMSGSTDAKVLSDQGVRIWDGNSSRAFLDQAGFPERRVGDLGPAYGHQMRHFGSRWEGPDADYRGKGFDQLAYVASLLAKDPTSRRAVINLWNPADLALQVLPPCHILSVFSVSDGELSCHLTMRSNDNGCGTIYNIGFYSLLTIMLARVIGLRPGEFVLTAVDSHVYLNQIEALREQLTRTPRPFPTLRIQRDVQCIDDFKPDDFELVGYDPHPAIKMPFSA